jgi:hypothetical protein
MAATVLRTNPKEWGDNPRRRKYSGSGSDTAHLTPTALDREQVRDIAGMIEDAEKIPNPEPRVSQITGEGQRAEAGRQSGGRRAVGQKLTNT